MRGFDSLIKENPAIYLGGKVINYSFDEALKYSNRHKLKMWLYSYLLHSANAANIIMELEFENYQEFCLLSIPAKMIKRECGFEDNMKYFENEVKFTSRVQDLVEAIVADAAIPPLLLVFEKKTNILELYDGAHRLEGYRKLGIEKIDAVVAFKDKSDVRILLDMIKHD